MKLVVRIIVVVGMDVMLEIEHPAAQSDEKNANSDLWAIQDTTLPPAVA